MEQKQYAGPSTLQSIVNCCKNLFATHRSVDDLAEDVAYINSEDNETITDAEVNDPSGGANIDVVASVGQTIVVKEVDANGKPTAWGSADFLQTTAQTLTDEQKAQARENIGAASELDPDIHAEYFQITDDGVVSLKPQYRGVGLEGADYSISDNGLGKAGSLINDLPEMLVIPDIVDEIGVSALAPSMFNGNERIKKLTIPSFITIIPERFCEYALYLREIHGTENVEVLNKGAFQRTAIEKAIFPTLKSFGGEFVFKECGMLVVADLGGVITEIPRRTFIGAERLSALRGVNAVTSVGKESFTFTHRLKNLPFLANLTSVLDRAFWGSRIDYDWSSLGNCTFGTNATVLQINPTDFWSTCTPGACETPLVSTFHQRNPAWANINIGNTSRTYGVDGCGAVCCAMIYSAFENEPLSSPQDFENIVKTINPSLMSLDMRYFNNFKQWLEAVGYTTTYYSGCDSTILQSVYNALAAGAMVIVNCMQISSSNGHGVLLYGVNANGEVMIVNSDSYSRYHGIYEALTYPSPIQNIIDADSPCEFLIVSK